MGFGKSFKKAWKKTLGWTDDSWMTDIVIPATKEQRQYKKEKIIFSTNWTSEKKLMSLDTELTHMKNIKSKETTDLIVKWQNIITRR